MRNINGLKKNSEFQRVYELRKSYADQYLIMYAAPNKMQISRIGISVSKKTGNSVVRHHVSRLMREAYRLNKELFDGGYDIVVVARPAAALADFKTVEKSYLKLLGRHSLLKKGDEKNNG